MQVTNDKPAFIIDLRHIFYKYDPRYGDPYRVYSYLGRNDKCHRLRVMKIMSLLTVEKAIETTFCYTPYELSNSSTYGSVFEYIENFCPDIIKEFECLESSTDPYLAQLQLSTDFEFIIQAIIQDTDELIAEIFKNQQTDYSNYIFNNWVSSFTALFVAEEG